MASGVKDCVTKVVTCDQDSGVVNSGRIGRNLGSDLSSSVTSDSQNNRSNTDSHRGTKVGTCEGNSVSGVEIRSSGGDTSDVRSGVISVKELTWWVYASCFFNDSCGNEDFLGDLTIARKSSAGSTGD